MDQVGQLFPRGKTFYGASQFRPTVPDNSATPYGTSVQLEGLEKEFKDTDPANETPGGVMPLASGGTVKMRLMRNLSASALPPGTLVKDYSAATRGRRCAINAENTDVPCGVVDDQLPAAGCPVNDLCWVAFKGHTRMIAPSNDSAWTAGTAVYPAATDGQGTGTIGSATVRVGIAMESGTSTYAGKLRKVDLQLDEVA